MSYSCLSVAKPSCQPLPPGYCWLAASPQDCTATQGTGPKGIFANLRKSATDPTFSGGPPGTDIGYCRVSDMSSPAFKCSSIQGSSTTSAIQGSSTISAIQGSSTSSIIGAPVSSMSSSLVMPPSASSPCTSGVIQTGVTVQQMIAANGPPPATSSMARPGCPGLGSKQYWACPTGCGIMQFL